jgi:hypothetical protein
VNRDHYFKFPVNCDHHFEFSVNHDLWPFSPRNSCYLWAWDFLLIILLFYSIQIILKSYIYDCAIRSQMWPFVMKKQVHFVEDLCSLKVSKKCAQRKIMCAQCAILLYKMQGNPLIFE